MAKHVNDGKCAKCSEILNGTDQRLIDWFTEFQKVNKDAHVAWGIRNEKDQNDAYKRGTSKAKYGESPHNFEPAQAIDLFRITQTGAEWGAPWFNGTVGPAVAKEKDLAWGGSWARFKDLPHIEIKDWKERVKTGIAKLPVKK